MSGVVIENSNDESVVFTFANGSLKVTIRRGDLSKETCDAIVNPTNEEMNHTGGLDTIIHQTMGSYYSDQVSAITNKFGKHACPVGQSRIFIAKFNRDEHTAHFVINTVGPIYKKDEQEQAIFNLQACYHTSLALANLYGLSSIAYSAISCGANKFPPHDAAKIGIEQVRQYSYQVKDVRFVLFDPQVYKVFVQEWTEYSQKINREADIIDDKDRPCTPPPSRILPPTSARYCHLCIEQQLLVDQTFLCEACLQLTRAKVFIKFLQRLRCAAETSFAELLTVCRSLQPILTNYPLVYTPVQRFDQSIHMRDIVAEHYVQKYCDKQFRNTMPVAVVGDGNCFYNTFVKLGGVGTTSGGSSLTSVELRARNIVELVLHRDEYQMKYTSLGVILDQFESYITGEMVRDANYVAIWDFFSIPTVLNVNIISVYPAVNGHSDMNFQKLNGQVYIPLISQDSSNDNQAKVATVKDVKILFSHCNRPVHLGAKKENWTPNHFVPLLSLRE